jgi:cation:H+ antiporter
MGIYPIFVVVAGLAVTVVASRWAVTHASMLSHGLSIPPFLIGVTILALGTDSPEIANSVMASLAGHGDLNVGDSVGSVFVQITFVLGILLLMGGSFATGSRRSATTPLLTILALGLGAVLAGDGFLTRLDGGLLVGAWVGATAIAFRYAPTMSEPLVVAPTRSKAVHAVVLLFSLALVAAGAGAAVEGIVQISRQYGVPEYLISFFGSSVGTSLPEMVVSIMAVRHGLRDLALGDILGACLLDATLSIGIGPLIAPTAVTADLALRGAFMALGGVFLASLLLWGRKRHDRWSGALLLLIYASSYVLLLSD